MKLQGIVPTRLTSLLTPVTNIGIAKTTLKFNNLLEGFTEVTERSILICMVITGKGNRLEPIKRRSTLGSIWVITKCRASIVFFL